MVRRSSKSDATNKHIHSPSEAGKLAVVKGRRFEDEVAELYQLQGAHITQNIEICNKKVDILATFTYPVVHRVIVECKDEKRAVEGTRRVREFYGLLTAARATNVAESAEIITRVPWGDAAKGFAREMGVGLFTYAEKISKLIDLTLYLKGLIDRFEKFDPDLPNEPALGKYYVDLSAEYGDGEAIEKIPVIDAYVHRWLADANQSSNLAIFGEYGAGKSSFCRKLACELAHSFLADPASTRMPILFNMREFSGKLDIEAYITAFLDRECSVPNPKIGIFKKMNEAGIFLLIFDGFDEMSVKVDGDKLESNLMEIEKFAATGGSKAILTSRPEYFVSAREEVEAVKPTENPLLNRKIGYEPLRILPWDDHQIEQFLKRRIPLFEGEQKPWTFYRDNIQRIERLYDLSHRPVLLDMIGKTLPTLIANGTQVNLPNLYKTYLTSEIKRQKVLKKRELLITEEDRLNLLQLIAAGTYDEPQEEITFAKTRNLIQGELKPPQHELEAHTREFLTNSFLVRRGDVYNFSHKSMWEYLIAAHVVAESKTGIPKLLQKRSLEPVILDFLGEMNLGVNKLFQWIERTRAFPFGDASILAGNAASLLCSMSTDSLANRDLSRTSLLRANLTLADLRRTQIKGASLKYCNFVGARLSLEDFQKAESVTDCLFSLFYINPRGREELEWTNTNLLRKLQREHQVSGISLGNQVFETGDFLLDNSAATMLVLAVNDIKTLHILREYCAEMLSTKVAIYWDEIEQLFEGNPEVKAVFARISRTAAAQTRDMLFPVR